VCAIDIARSYSTSTGIHQPDDKSTSNTWTTGIRPLVNTHLLEAYGKGLLVVESSATESLVSQSKFDTTVSVSGGHQALVVEDNFVNQKFPADSRGVVDVAADVW
jgi:hypothetical protein